MSLEALGPWPDVTVADAIVAKRGRETRKLKTPDYQAVGALPIIDQGSKLICGYTDDLSAAYPYDLPVVVFGDHTRVLKFVEFPFAIGADGTQCLHPNEGFDPQFFYYALSSLDLRSEGYARHFKLLKERRIPVPPLDEQRRIAEVLRSVDEAIAAATSVADRLDASLRAAVEDFIQSSAGEGERAPIGQLAVFVGSGVTPKGGKEAYLSAGIPLIRSQNVHFDGLRRDGLAFIDAATDAKMARTRVQPEDVLLNITGASIGRCTTAPPDFGPGNVNQHVCIIRTDRSQMHPAFLAIFLASYDGQRQIDQLQGGLSREGLNFQQVRAIEVPVPTLEAQAVLIESISSLRAVATFEAANIAKMHELKNGLMGDLLSGRVRVPA